MVQAFHVPYICPRYIHVSAHTRTHVHTVSHTRTLKHPTTHTHTHTFIDHTLTHPPTHAPTHPSTHPQNYPSTLQIHPALNAHTHTHADTRISTHTHTNTLTHTHWHKHDASVLDLVRCVCMYVLSCIVACRCGPVSGHSWCAWLCVHAQHQHTTDQKKCARIWNTCTFFSTCECVMFTFFNMWMRHVQAKMNTGQMEQNEIHI